MPGSNLTRLGVQSYSLREFEIENALRCLLSLGLDTMELCRVHLAPDMMHPEFRMWRDTLRCSGINVPLFGVEVFDADHGANRHRFEFAQALGVACITADPDPGVMDSVEGLAKEFNIRVAIHNHGPDSRYDRVADTLAALDGRSPLLGACLDTGHALRSGERPEDVVRLLGRRLHSLHLKDWKADGEEQRLGAGDLDLAALAESLRAVEFNGWIMFEYELEPANPVPGLRHAMETWKQAIAAGD